MKHDSKFLMTLDAARLLDCSSDTVRRYESRGLLHAVRTSDGTRLFDREEVEKLKAALRKKWPRELMELRSARRRD